MRYAVTLPRPLLVAPVWGCAAAALRVVLDERLAQVEKLAAAGAVTAQDLADTRNQFAAIREAARAWMASRASADGSVSAGQTEMPPPSVHEISTDRAADMLGLTPRRVRQMLAAGLLEGRQVGRTWMVARGSVELHRDARSAA